MAISRKAKNEEKLDSKTMEQVISLLEGDKPITKKDACAMLNIAYNTTRLSKLIDKHKEDKAVEARIRAEKRGTTPSLQEEKYAVQSYLIEGNSIESISKALYRSNASVLRILEKYAVPRRNNAYDYFKPPLVPEEACRSRFTIGEKVYSMNYDSMAIIHAEVPHKVHGYAYRVWLLSEKWQQFAYVAVEELASLKHLEEAGVL